MQPTIREDNKSNTVDLRTQMAIVDAKSQEDYRYMKIFGVATALGLALAAVGIGVVAGHVNLSVADLNSLKAFIYASIAVSMVPAAAALFSVVSHLRNEYKYIELEKKLPSEVEKQRALNPPAEELQVSDVETRDYDAEIMLQESRVDSSDAAMEQARVIFKGQNEMSQAFTTIFATAAYLGTFLTFAGLGTLAAFTNTQVDLSFFDAALYAVAGTTVVAWGGVFYLRAAQNKRENEYEAWTLKQLEKQETYLAHENSEDRVLATEVVEEGENTDYFAANPYLIDNLSNQVFVDKLLETEYPWPDAAKPEDFIKPPQQKKNKVESISVPALPLPGAKMKIVELDGKWEKQLLNELQTERPKTLQESLFEEERNELKRDLFVSFTELNDPETPVLDLGQKTKWDNLARGLRAF